MTQKKLSTEPYKGVRDFYPSEMAKQQYIFNQWSQTAERFGFLRYDTSILEPAELYEAKGSQSEEMVNEQTYTFTDRGNRRVTIRPEMTPSVARLVAGRPRELTLPLRWYSIPNLFRYERNQRGRKREHWQLNCDIFGSDDVVADIEIIALGHQILLDFGADESMFAIRLNDRRRMAAIYNDLGIKDAEQIAAITRLNDRWHKLSAKAYQAKLEKIVANKDLVQSIYTKLKTKAEPTDCSVLKGLTDLGITNVSYDLTLARGFDYYTGTIFEFFDTDPKNNRALLGGGRYDNLTALFGGHTVSGVGFGFGDVTMCDFLATHNLLPNTNTAPELLIIPTDQDLNLEGQKIARVFRKKGVNTAVDISNKKLNKKLSQATVAGVDYVLVFGEDELRSQTFTLKRLSEKYEKRNKLADLVDFFGQRANY